MIRFLFRWAFRFVILAIVLLTALVLLKDSILKSTVEYRIRARTGLDARIGRISSGFFSPSLTIENLKLYNSAEYGGSPLLDVPELHLEMHRTPLAFRRLHFKLVRLDIQEMNIVENKEGNTNVVRFLSELEQLASPNSAEPSWWDWKFQGIEVLNLSLGKIHYSSLKKPGKRTQVDVGLDHELFIDIKTLPELTDLLLNAMLKKGITFSSAAAPSGRRSASAEPKPAIPQRGAIQKQN